MEILSLAKPYGGLEQLLLTVSGSRSLAASDHSRLLEVDSATPVTLTVPAGLPAGMTVLVGQRGAGQVSLAAGAGVTLRSLSGELTLAGQYAVVTLLHRGADEWWVVGPTGPAFLPPSYDPYQAFVLEDHFLAASTETGEVGSLGWSFTNGSVAANNAAAGALGTVRRTSGTTANQVASLYLGAAANATRHRMDQWLSLFWRVAAVATNADHIVRVGLADDLGANPPANGVYLERLAADANWFSVTRVGGVQTRKDTGVAFDANWRKWEIRKSGTDVLFLADGAVRTTHSAAENPPGAAVGLAPGVSLVPTTTTARSLDIDHFKLVLGGFAL